MEKKDTRGKVAWAREKSCKVLLQNRVRSKEHGKRKLQWWSVGKQWRTLHVRLRACILFLGQWEANEGYRSRACLDFAYDAFKVDLRWE